MDCHTVWNSCLSIIKENVNEQSFKTWFMPIVPLQFVGNVLTIQVPSQFFYEYLEEHYVYLLRVAIDHVLGKEGRLEYSVVVDNGFEGNQPYTVNLPNKANRKIEAPSSINSSDYSSPFELKSIEQSVRDSHLNDQ